MCSPADDAASEAFFVLTYAHLSRFDSTVRLIYLRLHASTPVNLNLPLNIHLHSKVCNLLTPKLDWVQFERMTLYV